MATCRRYRHIRTLLNNDGMRETCRLLKFKPLVTRTSPLAAFSEFSEVLSDLSLILLHEGSLNCNNFLQFNICRHQGT